MVEEITTPFPDRMALAQMVETARAPSRLLDCYVWLIVGEDLGAPYAVRGHDPILPSEIVMGRWFGSALAKYPEDVAGVAENWKVPRFTSSTDAARTLFVDIGHVLWAPIGKRPSVSTQIDGQWSEYSFGANEAMAMTAAALRHGIQADPREQSEKGV